MTPQDAFDAVRAEFMRWVSRTDSPKPRGGGKPSNALIAFFNSPEGRAALRRLRQAQKAKATP